MKVRFAEKKDLEALAALWSKLPNTSIYGNMRFLNDVLEHLHEAGAVMVVTEDGGIVGGMVVAHSDAIRSFVGPSEVLKAVLGFYGSQLRLVQNFKRSRKFTKLIDNSHHGIFVYVEPEHRGEGLSVEMWNLAINAFSGKVTLLIDEENAASKKWSVKMGFKPASKVQLRNKRWTLYSKETE